MVIEVEVRSFVTEERYGQLLEFFKREGKWLSEDMQETWYFDCPADVRIQKNNFSAKIWMKGGRLHDLSREEVEVQFAKEDFDKVARVFAALGHAVQIKWFRKRFTFSWKECKVMLDYTRGYGYIIELEKLTDESEQNVALTELYQLLASLNIILTPREEFDKKFAYYKEHWKELTGEQ